MKKRLLALALLLLLAGCGSAPSTQADASKPPEASEPVVQPNIVSTLAVCGDAMSHMPQTRDAYDSQAGAYDYKPMIRFAKPWIEQADYAAGQSGDYLCWRPGLLGLPGVQHTGRARSRAQRRRVRSGQHGKQPLFRSRIRRHGAHAGRAGQAWYSPTSAP